MSNPIPISAASPNEEWETPDDLFAVLTGIWDFDFDAAANAANAKCARYISPYEDARFVDWCEYGKRAWLNPPYGRAIVPFIEAAQRAREHGVGTVALLPARTDTRWWHDHVAYGANAAWLLKGRLRFKGAPHAAPFPSVVVFWPSRTDTPLAEWEIATLSLMIGKGGFENWGVRLPGWMS